MLYADQTRLGQTSSFFESFFRQIGVEERADNSADCCTFSLRDGVEDTSKALSRIRSVVEQREQSRHPAGIRFFWSKADIPGSETVFEAETSRSDV